MKLSNIYDLLFFSINLAVQLSLCYGAELSKTKIIIIIITLNNIHIKNA